MNPRNLPPIGPLILIGGGIYAAVKVVSWVFGSNAAERKPQFAAPENPPVRSFPPPKKPAPAPALAATPINPIPQTAELPERRLITRQEMAAAFRRTRGMSQKAAVTALKHLDCWKTAAYEALSDIGRFAKWLQFAAGGTIALNN